MSLTAALPVIRRPFGVERVKRQAAALGLTVGLGLAAMATPLWAQSTMAVGTPEAMPASGDVMPATAGAPVVLELYTSQGCQSCPPADAMVRDLAGREDVIALALHVDYWDYIGWADSFAQPAFGERQKDYARRHGHTTIYTPQVIVGGTDILEGFRVMDVMDTLSRHQARAGEVTLSLARDAASGMLSIRAEALDGVAPQVALASRRVGMTAAAGNAVVGTLSMGATAESAPQADSVVAPHAPFVVELVRYLPSATVEILSGENAGLMADYANIVTEWTTVATWDMLSPLALDVPAAGDQGVVVIIQERGLGEVVAAARLR